MTLTTFRRMIGSRLTRLRAPIAVLIALSGLLALPAPDAVAAPHGFAIHDAPREVPEIRFADAAGNGRSLADFRGRTILLNIWATWCPPCIKEMPTLDRLQAELGGPDFEVVALSIDRAGPEVVRSFYDKIGVRNLALYIDETGRAAARLGAFGFPATVLIDPERREIGRLIGPAEWEAPDMIDFLRGVAATAADRS
jgi:thiol-disulfide isomerase/thioredoxin